MPDFSVSIDIEPWEYVSECTRSEIEDLIESLVEDGHLDSFNGKVKPKKEGNSIMEIEWDDVITKIRNSKHLLSNDDESRIIEIANKLV
jgi:uncharacterized protein YpbB